MMREKKAPKHRICPNRNKLFVNHQGRSRQPALCSLNRARVLIVSLSSPRVLDIVAMIIVGDRMMRTLKLVLKLGRLKMTVFSAVTYGTAASVANLALIEAGSPSEFDAGLFLAGWAFVFFTQLVAHFLGEMSRI